MPRVPKLIGALLGRRASWKTRTLDKAVLVAVAVFIMLLPVVTTTMLQVVAFAMLITLLLPTLPWMWRVPVVLTSAATVGRELETRRWQALRATPYSTYDIVLALLAAGTHRVYLLWLFTTIARVILGLMLTLSLHWEMQIGNLVGHTWGMLDWVAWGLSLSYLILEPLLDVAIDGAVGIVSATFSNTQFRAMTYGMALRLGLWLTQLLSLFMIVPLAEYLLSSAQAQAMPTVVLMGPVYNMLFGFSAQTTLVMLAGFLALRLLTLYILVRVAVWRGEQVVV
jgi:hypothetical protein